jgi:hypothetical protein
MIPEPGTSVLIQGHPMEITQTRNNAIRRVKAAQKLERFVEQEGDS